MQKKPDSEKIKLAERLDIATKSAKIGIWDWDIKNDHLVWDDRMYQLYGVDPKNFTVAYDAWLNGTHPEDRADNDLISKKAINENIPYDTEFRVIWPDQSIHWLKANAEVFRDAEGKAIRMVGINYDITEKKSLIRTLEESERKYSVLFNKAGVPAVLVKLPEAYFVDANDAFEEIFGYSKQEMIGKTSLDLGLVNPNARAQTIREVAQYGTSFDNERVVFTKSGKVKIVTQMVNQIELNDSKYVITTLTDITEIKHKERRIQQLNRLYATLSQINQAIVRQNDQNTLFDEICYITIKFGQYAMSNIGLIDENKSTFTLVSSSNLDKTNQDFNSTIPLNKTDVTHPIVQSIMTKKCVIISDLDLEADSDWKRSLLQQKYLSLAVIPIFIHGHICGALTVASTYTNTFGSEDERLLTEIGGDISFALDTIDNIDTRQRAQSDLMISEEKYKVVADNTFDWEYWVSPEGQYLYISPSVERITGYSPIKFKDLDFMLKIVHPGDVEQFKEHRKIHSNRSDTHSSFEFRIIREDGEVRWIAHTCKCIIDDSGKYLGRRASNRDITDQKDAQNIAIDSLLKMKNSFKDAINALSLAIEMRDPYTSGHQYRVSKLGTAIATEMGLDESTIEGIQVAGLVHDIGKLSIPAEILSKPSKLSNIEYTMIKEHPTTGYQILSKINFPWPIAEIVRQHHERLDGSGYPRNLKQNEILLEARILIVADVVEAMSSHRPYRPALGVDAALFEINDHKGLSFDADVVEACNRLFSKGEFLFDDGQTLL